MVEASRPQYPLSHRLLRFLAGILTGGMIAQLVCCLTAYLLINDSQAAGMIGNLIMQQLSYYFLGGGFIILSFSNILIKIFFINKQLFF